MFVNETGGGECSQVWRVDLSPDRTTAARTWSYEPECYYNHAAGPVSRRPTYGTLSA